MLVKEIMVAHDHLHHHRDLAMNMRLVEAEVQGVLAAPVFLHQPAPVEQGYHLVSQACQRTTQQVVVEVEILQ
jgi:hypothetical protein